MATVVEKKQPAAGAIMVLLRPDTATDSSHDEWHTLYVQPTTTSADVDAWLTTCKADVEARYSAMQTANSLITVIQ